MSAAPTRARSRPVPAALAPLARVPLSDSVARRIMDHIEAEQFRPEDRLPTISTLASQFGVGPATVREALKKLQTLGAVDIRHGSGVYVGSQPNTLIVSNPVLSGAPTKERLVHLVEARLPSELEATRLAARHGTREDFDSIEALLLMASDSLSDTDLLCRTNMSFHAAIAQASGNEVLFHILDALANLYRDEQRTILDIFGSRSRDHDEHRAIFEALENHDEALATERMEAHLRGVRDALLRWDESAQPLAEVDR